ncbi:unnamed protein product [Sympodiomycopsis kandeliae]
MWRRLEIGREVKFLDIYLESIVKKRRKRLAMAASESEVSIQTLISQLSEHANSGSSKTSSEGAQSLSDELLALQAIYARDESEQGLKVVQVSDADGSSQTRWTPKCKIRLELKLPLDLPSNRPSKDAHGTSTVHPPDHIRLSITLLSNYPQGPTSGSAPQFQLLDRFIGPMEVDSRLFGQVLRTVQSVDGSGSDAGGDTDRVAWTAGEVVLFEGCENVKERVEKWYKEREEEQLDREKRDGRGGAGSVVADTHGTNETIYTPQESTISRPVHTIPPHIAPLLRSKSWYTTEAVVEKKSTFVGHAIRLDSSEEVPYLLNSLLEKYPKMLKATHPFMRAYVCSNNKVVERDNDDNGETAAGGRLAHLLEMLHVTNALVVVTRWYGGIHLGSDRFKLINRVAREALQGANLIPQK